MSANDNHHEHHVLGGHKAAIHNARVGPAAKLHSVGVLNDADIDVNVHHGQATFDPPHFHEKKHGATEVKDEEQSVGVQTRSTGSEMKGEQGDEHHHRVIGGYKATLSNPSTSDEAKAHAREMLRQAGEDV